MIVRPLTWQRLILAGVGCMLLFAAVLHAQRPNDYQVKAVYLFNFGRFTMWPSTAAQEEGAFKVCVLGSDPFGQTLDATIANERIDDRRLVAVRLAQAEEAVTCRILFVSASEERQLPRILKTLERAGVLTVSDMTQFVARGGMIQFVSQDNRVRFEVNLTALERERLVVSSELLRVAVAVRRIAG